MDIFFFFQGYGDHRDLHRVDRRQRQMCIRDRLTDEQQQIIREAAETAKQYAREQADERIASKIKTIEDSGTQIITLSDEVHEQIRKECQPIYESIEKNVSSDIVEAYPVSYTHLTLPTIYSV